MSAKTATNPYLTKLIGEYDGIKKAIAAMRAKAVAENRDLSDTENQQVSQMQTRGQTLAETIKTVGEEELRNVDIAAMAARLAGGTDTDDQTGTDTGGDSAGFRRVGGATTRQRDPGHYRSIKDGGKHSFFGDLWKSHHGDQAARTRLDEHMRNLDTAGEGAGVLPPKWLADEFAEEARQGRALANVVRNIPLGDDPRPMSLPRQSGAAATGGAPVTIDQNEVTNDTPTTSFTDAWDSHVDTVTPLASNGGQVMSRQLLDMANPAIDALIYSDLIGAYDDGVEAKVAAAIAVLGTALPAVDGDDVADPTHYNRVALDAAMQVRQNRKRPPTIWTMSNIRYGKVLGLVDTTGRPLVPAGTGQPVNVSGVGTVAVDGIWHGLPVVATAGFSDDDEFFAVRSSDVLLFESNMYRFRYEQPLGPDLVKIGIWAYTAVYIKYGTAPVKRVEIADESS